MEMSPPSRCPLSLGYGEEGYYKEGPERGRTTFFGPRGFEHSSGSDSLYELFFLNDPT
jgi:hypothetical protein